MNLKEALTELRDGKKIRRAEWIELMHLKLVSSLVTINDNEILLPTIMAFRQETVYYNYDNSILLSLDWLVEGDDEFEMPFAHALECLTRGMKIKLRGWPSHTYLLADPLNQNIWMNSMIEYPYILPFSDLTATDWEILE